MAAVGIGLPRRELVDQFQRLWYGEAIEREHTYFGLQMAKCPLDMAIYAEVVHGLRPGLIVETGTCEGASALHFAHLLDQLGHGLVLSVDLARPTADYPRHPRIAYLGGRSPVAESTLAEVQQWVRRGQGPVLVALVSDHSRFKVAAELRAYADLVTPGSYLVVEDTASTGPREAVGEWLADRGDFEVDLTMGEKFLVSFNTWLKRRWSPDEGEASLAPTGRWR
jgi:cephalosporin hydroxylase